jgi:peptide/nickel transport system substrate-binding protein
MHSVARDTSSSRRRLALPSAALALAALLAAGCPTREVQVSTGGGTGPGTTAPAAKPHPRGNRLVIGLEQEPDKLNTALNAMVYGTYINNTLYGYFVKYDEKMNLIPDVVTEVPTLQNGGISADYMTYTYHLRPGLKWHDGHPFTAADVLFSVDVIMNPLHEMESRIGYDHIKSSETPDDLTVVFHMTEPFAPFTSTIFFSEGLMPKHLLADKVGASFGTAAYHRAPVGLGPFMFKEWVTGSHVSIVPFPEYFRGKPSIDEITFRFIPDTNTLLVALQAGEIDGFDNAGTDQRNSLDKIASVKSYVTPQLMWEHVDFNTEHPILKDVRVRQAIQLGIDRTVISAQIYEGLWPPAYGDVEPRLPWHDPKVTQLVRFDPEAARALLDEAGWKLGEGGGVRSKGGKPLKLELSTTAGRRQRELAEEVIQQQLSEIGIQVDIQNHNATAFFAPFEQDGVLKKAKFDMALYAWITSPDPDKKSLYHSSQRPPDGQNHPRLKNARLDQLLDQGLHELDDAKRKPIYDEVQELLATQVPMTPIVWRADIDAMTVRLQNFKPNPTQNGDTWNVWEWSLTP